MNTTHTSKTTRCWRAQAPVLGRLIVFASLLAGSIAGAFGDLGNGDFEKQPNASWKRAKLDPMNDENGNPLPQGGTSSPKITAKGGGGAIKGNCGQIGRDKTTGADGVDGAVLYQDFQCNGTDAECQVTFDYVWQPAPGSGEYAAVFMARADPNDATLYIGNWTTEFAEADNKRISITGCGAPDVRIGVFIGGSTNGTQSTLLIDNVTSTCVHVASHGGDFRQTMKGNAVAAVPSGPVKTVLAVAPLGYSVLGNFLAAGGNTFGEVLAGASAGTLLFKWDSKTQSYSKYTYGTNGAWQPPGGTLAPGEAAIIHSESQQIIALTGRVVPQLARPRRPAGSYLVSATGPNPQHFDEFMGFPPAPRDRVLRFSQPSFDFPPPSTSTSTYGPNGWDVEPIVNEGEGVAVELVNTGVVAGRDQLHLKLDIVGDGAALQSSLPLDSNVLLQTAPHATGPWTTVSGVQTPFFPPLDVQMKFFRLLMPP